jgi:hypothetical protein
MASVEPQKNSSGLKIFLWIIAIVGGLGLLTCGGCVAIGVWFAKDAMVTDPAKVAELADTITTITPPAGYQPQMGMNIKWVGMRMVIYSGEEGDEQRMMMLMALPASAGGGEEQMRQQMDTQMKQQGKGKDLEISDREERSYLICGKETPVTVAKGTDNQGQEFRQITAVFEAKDGSPAMFMMMMPEEEWSSGGEAAMEATLASTN